MSSTRQALVALATTIAALVATGAHAQLDAQKKLAQIDRSFVCPEDLPTEQAKQDALKLFLEEVAAAQRGITLGEMTEYRLALLRKHECRKTLANIGTNSVPVPMPAPSAPSTSIDDHWEQAGRIAGANGITISVDMDSMKSAGPGRMRTWIKFQYDKPDRKGVKESLVYEQLDCARNYHSTISIYSYAADGHIVYSGSGKAEDEEPIIPESLLAGILPFTCAAHGLSTR